MAKQLTRASRTSRAGQAPEIANFICSYEDYWDNLRNERLTTDLRKHLLGPVPKLHQLISDVAGIFHTESAFEVRTCVKALLNRFSHLRFFSMFAARYRLLWARSLIGLGLEMSGVLE